VCVCGGVVPSRVRKQQGLDDDQRTRGRKCLVDDAVVAARDDVVAAELELLRPYARTAQSLVATDNNQQK
jgi:hypothetical protein